MKKRMILLLLIVAFSIPLVAQQLPQLPLDPKVKTGKLDNGLTYYIQKNTEPKGQANFYIVQKVGSILEEENQRGLAHFLEHMAFNGSKNFPGKNMINYLEKIGVKFGANLNAATGFDQTIYNIDNVPVSRQGVIDSCLLILHDWSSFLSLDHQEIDNERGVIREEWRTRSNATLRMYEKMLQTLFAGSQYQNRMPIGLIDVINNFKYQELKDYYKKWYRPDLQGIVIVGDIDPDKMEQSIKTMFADIPAPVNPAERTEFKVGDNEEPIVAFATDPEAQTTQIMVFYKRDVMPAQLRPTAAALGMRYMLSLISDMLNNRFQEMLQKPNAPFSYAVAEDGNFFIAKTKDAFMTVAVADKDGVIPAISALSNEAERARQFGFTASEYERAKSDFLRAQENLYKDREKQKSSYYVNKYINNFIEETPAPGIEAEYALYQQLASAITVDQINMVAKQIIGEKNVAIGIMAPQKEGVNYPTTDEIIKAFNKARTENVVAYKDEVSNEPLISELPKPGKVVKEAKDDKFGATVWTLSNGIKVIVKKTDFKDDEIILTGTNPGGSSLVIDADAINLKVINDVFDEVGGVGNFSKTALQKMLAGKKVSASTSIDTRNENLNGSSSPKDLETMMQLLYLKVTSPRIDADAFTSMQSRYKSILASYEADPMISFNDSLISTIYKNHPRKTRLTASMLDKADYNRIMDIYKERFANNKGFVVTIVGNVNPDTLKPLVEQYIATLPAGKVEKAVDIKADRTKGVVTNYFDRDMQIAKTSVAIIYTGNIDYTPKSIVEMSMLKQMLDILYTETIREEEGGTYGVSVGSKVDDYPHGNFTLMAQFDTDPKLKDKLIAKVKSGLEDFAINGPSAESLNKVKEFMLKKYGENIRENHYWLNIIDSYYTWGIDNYSGYEKLVKSITVNDIKAFTKAILDQKNCTEVVMTGKEKK